MTNKISLQFTKKEILLIAIVALGYFVDVYDILLFSAVRKPSLLALGILEQDLANIGLNLLNWQLFGMIVGGVVWGIIADKIGRKKVLFGSILFYSSATFLNAFVTNIEMYTLARFIAGFGLAGELGVGIALITENVRRDSRTMATTIVATFGMLGGILAALIASKMEWQTSYMVGGLMGLGLLIFRFTVSDSILFKNIKKNTGLRKGDFFMILKDKKLFQKYLWSILVGAPTYVFAGLFITLSPEYGLKLGLSEAPSAAMAVMYFYIFLTVFDGISGLLSKHLQSRTKAIKIFLVFQFLVVIIYLFIPLSSLTDFYIRCGLVGASLGYWTVLITNAAEQFGTNLRATVSTSVPNFARGIQIPISFLFKLIAPLIGIIYAGAFVTVLSILIAYVAIVKLKDNFEIDADFVEQ